MIYVGNIWAYMSFLTFSFVCKDDHIWVDYYIKQPVHIKRYFKKKLYCIYKLNKIKSILMLCVAICVYVWVGFKFHMV